MAQSLGSGKRPARRPAALSGCCHSLKTALMFSPEELAESWIAEEGTCCLQWEKLVFDLLLNL